MVMYKNAPVTASSPSSVVKNWAKDEAVKEFKNEKKADFAADCAEYAHNYIKKMPVGWNNTPAEVDKLKEAITKGIKQDVVPKHYSTFTKVCIGILAVVFWPITIDILIVWAICKVFDVHFGK